MRITLMADVPDQPIGRRVEHMVQRHGQLDHAQAGAEMAAGHGDRVDRLLTQLVRQLPQHGGVEAANILGRADLVEQGCLRGMGHCCSQLPVLSFKGINLYHDYPIPAKIEPKAWQSRRPRVRPAAIR